MFHLHNGRVFIIQDLGRKELVHDIQYEIRSTQNREIIKASCFSLSFSSMNEELR